METESEDWLASLDWDESRKICMARQLYRDLSGENRFYIAPAEDEYWHAWGEWHASYIGSNGQLCIEEMAGDAVYDFANGGALFPTRDAATRAIYHHLAGIVATELEEQNASSI